MSEQERAESVLADLLVALHDLSAAEQALTLAEKVGYEMADGKTAEIRKAQAAEFAAEAKAAVDSAKAHVEHLRRLHETLLVFAKNKAA